VDGLKEQLEKISQELKKMTQKVSGKDSPHPRKKTQEEKDDEWGIPTV